MSPFNSTSPCFGLTIEQCQDLTGNHSSWLYRPSLVLNGLLIGIFGASLVANIIQGTLGRTWGFAIAMVLGCTSKSDPDPLTWLCTLSWPSTVIMLTLPS